MTENSSCLNGIIRRLLCTGNVPTHPSSDYILDSNPTQLAKPHKPSNNEPKYQTKPSSPATVTPGIVARLMGLDSLPLTNWERAPDLVKRSKSVSFADYLMDFDLTPTNNLHRRVRTSVSFREVPAAMSQPEGKEYLVVYLDSLDKEEDGGKVKKKTEEVKQGKEQRSSKSSEVVKKKNEEKLVKRNSKVLKVKDEPMKECSVQVQASRAGRNCRDEGLGYSVRPYKKVGSKNGSANIREGSGEHSPLKKTTTQKMKKKKVVEEPKFKKGDHQNAAQKREAVDHSSCSDNSSPVSVFDIDDILFQHEAWLSEYSSPKDLKSQMKSPPRASSSEDPELRAVKIKDMEPIKDEDSGDYNELLARTIFRLTEEELKESNWVSKNVVEYERLEEICAEVEGLILDVLMKQTIDDIVQLSQA